MDQVLLKDFFEEEDSHWWHAAKRKLILSFLPKAQGRILVLGIGGGRLCFELARSFDVTALDISPVACKHSQEAYGLKAIECDLENGLPFENAAFDVIIIADVLEHIHHDRQLIMEIYRCLAQGGRLLLTVPAYAHMWSYWDERLSHCRRYEYRALKTLIMSEHFKIRKISFFHMLIYPAALIRRKLFGMKKNDTSDFKISQGWTVLKSLMGAYYAIERACVHAAFIPFGLSLFVCAEKE